jgi:hypothetical protein
MEFNKLINEVMQGYTQPEVLLDDVHCKCTDCIYHSANVNGMDNFTKKENPYGCYAKSISLTWGDGPGSSCECQTYQVKGE